MLADTNIELKEYIVDDKHNQSLLDTSVRIPGSRNDYPCQSKDSGSET